MALANKIARTIWALLVKGGVYQAPAAMLKTYLRSSPAEEESCRGGKVQIWMNPE
ncbi:hypothetical protein [Bradyrhizobium sp. 18]|uniref:hypothetical protein n=1 Tax=Bradyrhizobium sp. 18 TaxID=2782657 RepID=UPI0032119BD9